MANIKELSRREALFTGGHRACAGCAGAIALRQVMLAAGTKPVVVGSATGCMEVVSTLFPYTSWKVPFIHSAFENSAATISGAEAAYQSLKRQGKIDKEINFIAFGGDGGTYDIGLQSLSGAMERGHNMLYVCYNNEAYMNCLSLSSLIATEDGIKKITELKVGDMVYALDLETHQLVLKPCSGIFDNGVRDVYELTTLHHSIKATANHPFLVLKRNGRGKTSELVWKKLEDITPGDEIVVSKQLAPGKSAKFYAIDGCRLGQIPDTSLLKDTEPDQTKIALCESATAVQEYPSQYKYQNFLAGNEHFAMEKVTSITLAGKEPTLDLRVDDEHNFIANGIVVHNTGIQRSGATPLGASTTTAPSGTVKQGKEQNRKNLTKIMIAHDIPYVGQAIVGNWKDLVEKIERALAVNGPKFVNILAPCRLGWAYKPEDTVAVGMLAADTCLWPLYEVSGGVYKLNYKPKEKKPVIEYLKTQARFKHILAEKNKSIVDTIQAGVDKEWQDLLKLCGEAQ